ncbi:adenylate/guanylate cyclase domain-containing protein [Rhodovulum sp. DZ06]|uniref:adenylate/guanylate cyclase domain-containing protein n=1 Tax=Rhodovulum sp. DZ06 TaxID=3425126 RepID=UPI003D34B655
MPSVSAARPAGSPAAAPAPDIAAPDAAAPEVAAPDAPAPNAAAPDVAAPAPARGLLRRLAPPPPRDPVGRAMAREEISALGWMLAARLAALGLLGVWVLATLPIERAGLYAAVIAGFAALGFPPWLLARRMGHATLAAAPFLTLDACLLAYVLIVPSSYAVEGWTPILNLRLGNVVYMFVFLAGMALSQSPRLVMWSGISAVLAWTAGYLWVAGLPGARAYTSVEALEGAASTSALIADFLSPDAVSLTRLANEVMALSLATVILTLTVQRGSGRARRRLEAEAHRAALSRYFPPELAEELAADPAALDRPVKGPAAALFVDLVGFTALSERLPPENVLALLGELQARVVRAAASHGGAVDKMVGDGALVHFGLPRPRGDEAARALACAGAILAEMEAWREELAAQGGPAVRVGIGLHFGEAIAGSFGDARRRDYTVLGDTVNVASRLERLTRAHGARLAVSAATLAEVRRAGRDPAALAPPLRAVGPQRLPGRAEPVEVYIA